MRLRFLLAFLLMLVPMAAQAVQVNEMLPDPALEHRARVLSAQLRCLVCQNQSIDDSDAPLAHDLRVLVRQRLLAGDSDEAVKKYLVNRYGEFILLEPSFSPKNYLLWLFPALALISGLGLVLYMRKQASSVQSDNTLTPEEQAKLARILDRDAG